MKPTNKGNCPGFEEAFYGSSTVGERGQIVIPAEARAELGFNAGDKVLIMRHPIYKGLMICKFDAVRQFLDEFTLRVNELEALKDKEETEE